MAKWNYDPKQYTARNFELIPAGDYRVKINSVKEKIFNSGNEGFEIVLDVPGRDGKLWYYLVIDPDDSAKTNQRIGMFFDSFAIRNHDLSDYDNWVGRDGAVRVKHNTYNGTTTANVVFCLSRSQQKKFPDFVDCCPEKKVGHETKFNGFNMPSSVREIPPNLTF